MTILAWDNGKVVAGRRMVNTAADFKYMEYWETANIFKLQLPPGPGAPNASASPPPTPPIETPAPLTKPTEKGSTQDHTTDHTPAPTGSNCGIPGTVWIPGTVYLIRDSPPSGTMQPAITNHFMRICQSNTPRFANRTVVPGDRRRIRSRPQSTADCNVPGPIGRGVCAMAPWAVGR